MATPVVDTDEPLDQAIPRGNLSRLNPGLYNNLATFPDRAAFKATILEYIEYATLGTTGPDVITDEVTRRFIALIAGADITWGIAATVIPAFRLDRDSRWNNNRGYLAFLRRSPQIIERLPTREFRAGADWEHTLYMSHMKDEMDFLAFGKRGPEATPQEAADLDHWARGTADLFNKIRNSATGLGLPLPMTLQAPQAAHARPNLDLRFPALQETPRETITTGNPQFPPATQPGQASERGRSTHRTPDKEQHQKQQRPLDQPPAQPTGIGMGAQKTDSQIRRQHPEFRQGHMQGQQQQSRHSGTFQGSEAPIGGLQQTEGLANQPSHRLTKSVGGQPLSNTPLDALELKKLSIQQTYRSPNDWGNIPEVIPDDPADGENAINRWNQLNQELRRVREEEEAMDAQRNGSADRRMALQHYAALLRGAQTKAWDSKIIRRNQNENDPEYEWRLWNQHQETKQKVAQTQPNSTGRECIQSFLDQLYSRIQTLRAQNAPPPQQGPRPTPPPGLGNWNPNAYGNPGSTSGSDTSSARGGQSYQPRGRGNSQPSTNQPNRGNFQGPPNLGGWTGFRQQDRSGTQNPPNRRGNRGRGRGRGGR